MITTIGDLVAQGAIVIGDGYRTRRDELRSSGFRILRVADVEDGYLDPSGRDYVGEDFVSRSSEKISRQGDIVLTTKGTVGRVAIVDATDEIFVYSPQVCFLRVVEKQVVHPYFLLGWLRSTEFKVQAGYLMANTDMAAYLSLRDLRSLRMNLPDLDAQKKVGRFVEAIETKIRIDAREIFHLRKMRDSLLGPLVSGQLKIEEATRVVAEVI